MKTKLEVQAKILVQSGTVYYDFSEISGPTGIALAAGNVAFVNLGIGEVYTYSDGAVFTIETVYEHVEIE